MATFTYWRQNSPPAAVDLFPLSDAEGGGVFGRRHVQILFRFYRRHLEAWYRATSSVLYLIAHRPCQHGGRLF